MTDYIGNYKNRPRRVVFYGRVSTEHEEQLSALGNQMEWYTDLALRNPNWTVVAQYIDEGITGTQMKKRPSFMQTDSRSRGQSESYSQNTQRLGRELMTPAELATMPGDKCILQLRGLPPFFSPKYDLKRHPNYRYTAEADKQKNAFDLDRLINRRRRPGLNEACTMYEVAVPDDALTEEDEDILNYDDIDDPDAFA